MKKKFLLCIFSMLYILLITACSNGNVSEQGTDKDNQSISQTDYSLEWSEITEDGVNEKLLFENLDTEILEKVAKNLQNALEEELQEEKENPEILITEGWTRIFDKEQYKEVIDIGKPAMKSLYWILYKSPNNGLYEYLCATALCEISGVGGEISEDGTMKWSTAKEYLELFTKTVMNKE